MGLIAGVFVIPCKLPQLPHIIAEGIHALRPRLGGIFPLGFSRQAITFRALFGVQALDEGLRIVPRHIFHRPAATFEFARILPHHRDPLVLGDRIFAQKERSADPDRMLRLLIVIRLHKFRVRAHVEGTRRNQDERHADAVGKVLVGLGNGRQWQQGGEREQQRLHKLAGATSMTHDDIQYSSTRVFIHFLYASYTIIKTRAASFSPPAPHRPP